MWSVFKTSLLGAFVRAWMFNSGFHLSLSDRVEISTPLNSWKRGKDHFRSYLIHNYDKCTCFLLAVEGVYLYERSLSPYDGDVFHETPIWLVFYTYLLKVNTSVLQAIFILCDIATAILLTKATRLFFCNMVGVLSIQINLIGFGSF